MGVLGRLSLGTTAERSRTSRWIMVDLPVCGGPLTTIKADLVLIVFFVLRRECSFSAGHNGNVKRNMCNQVSYSNLCLLAL